MSIRSLFSRVRPRAARGAAGPSAAPEVRAALRTAVAPVVASIPRVDVLESRVLLGAAPQADISVGDIDQGGGSTVTVNVTYTDDDAVARSSVGGTDVTVTPVGGGPALTLHTVSATPEFSTSPIFATYVFDAPGGTWDASDDGDYVATVEQDRVFDLDGNPVPVTSAGFHVGVPGSPTPTPTPTPTPIPSPTPTPTPTPVPTPTPTPTPPPTDTTPPTAAIDRPDNVTSRGGVAETIVVRYADDIGINVSTLGTSNVTVRGPSGHRLTVTNFSSSGSGTAVTGIYTFLAPGGTWSTGDNGTYTVTANAGAVADTSGNPTGGDVATFVVNVPSQTPTPTPTPIPVPTPTPSPSPTPTPPPDTTVPLATVAPPADITQAGGATQTVTVTFTDDTAVNASSIGAGDLSVTGPGGAPVSVTGVSLSPNGNSPSVTATFTLAAPGGSWDAADNGRYTVTLAGSAVTDTSGNAAAGAAVTFNVSISGHKQPLDPSFNGGQVESGFVAESTVTQPDGKIVVAGRMGDLSAGTSRSVLKRYNPNGAPDPTFGDGGTVLGPDGGNDAAFAVVIADDGGILTAGTHDGDFSLTKYKANGALDGKFGGVAPPGKAAIPGQSSVDLGGADDTAYDLAVGPDGSIVLGGGSNGAFAFARFLKDGNPDPFFGQHGLALYAYGAGNNVVGSVAIMPDGRIVAAGDGGGSVAALRLTPDGGEDPTFGAGGVVTVTGLATRTDLGKPDHTVGVALQPDGRILVNNRTPGGDFGLARLNPDGRADAGFGSNGVVTSDFGGDDDANVVLVQGSGEILVVGTTNVGGGADAAVAAFGRDGTPDTSFGDNGKYMVDGSLTPTGRALHSGELLLRAFGNVQPNGQLIVGTSNEAPQAVSSSGLRRLNVPGSGLLGNFGNVGKKNHKLSFLDGDNTRVTLSLKGGGSGQAFFDGTNVDIVLTGTTGSSSLSFSGKGGNGRVGVRNIMAGGALKSVTGKNTDLTGTLSVNGNLGKVTLGRVTGTIAAAGSITSVSLGGELNGGMILAGATSAPTACSAAPARPPTPTPPPTSARSA